MKLTADKEKEISKAIIDLFRLQLTAPRFSDLKRTISIGSITLRGALNYHDTSKVEDVLSKLPNIYFGHVIDMPVIVCDLFSDLLQDEISYNKWALCFDEVEIAPDWMRTELFESLRSIAQQRIYLKLTCSPLLPSGLRSAPEEIDDYQPIRLWYSHTQDALNFCEGLTNTFLNAHFATQINATSLFNNSEIADQDDKTSYERNSPVYREMVALAQKDSSFRELLEQRGLNPNDPYDDSKELRDTFFRKIKPIVMLRNAFRDEIALRTRKVPKVEISKKPIYSGKQAIYLMSEGNPRLMQRLLTDIYDRWRANPLSDSAGRPFIADGDQAKTLNAAARRFQALLSATASGSAVGSASAQHSLLEFINVVGFFFKEELLGDDFNMDPIGTFVVGDEPEISFLEPVIEKALELGAIVYIGKSDDEIPKSIKGSRFRLSYTLAPIYRLPFRVYRPVTFYRILRTQMTLFKRKRS